NRSRALQVANSFGGGSIKQPKRGTRLRACYNRSLSPRGTTGQRAGERCHFLFPTSRCCLEAASFHLLKSKPGIHIRTVHGSMAARCPAISHADVGAGIDIADIDLTAVHALAGQLRMAPETKV